VAESALWVHDETDRATATLLAQLWAARVPDSARDAPQRVGRDDVRGDRVQQEQKPFRTGVLETSQALVSGGDLENRVSAGRDKGPSATHT